MNKKITIVITLVLLIAVSGGLFITSRQKSSSPNKPTAPAAASRETRTITVGTQRFSYTIMPRAEQMHTIRVEPTGESTPRPFLRIAGKACNEISAVVTQDPANIDTRDALTKNINGTTYYMQQPIATRIGCPEKPQNEQTSDEKLAQEIRALFMSLSY